MEMLEILLNIINGFYILEFVVSGVMCVYGFKWSKGLIATMSLYIGIALGIGGFYLCAEAGAGFDAILLIPIVAISFWILAYKWVLLNHFLAGCILGLKVTFMILSSLMKDGLMDIDLGILLAFSVLVGIVFGLIVCIKYNNLILIMCVAFIGATEFVPRLMEWINRGLFAVTGDISYLFDPVDFLLGLLGLEITSLLDAFLIITVAVCSFFWQRQLMISRGIDLSDIVIDDR